MRGEDRGEEHACMVIRGCPPGQEKPLYIPAEAAVHQVRRD
jgi:hypothetical protein